MKHLLAAAALSTVLSTSCCVARSARVRVPRGSRSIEELTSGDEVICVNPRTGELIAAPLLEIRSATRECVRMVTGGAALTLTSDHPVYCPRSALWAPAGDWALGVRTHLLEVTADGLRAVPVIEASTYYGVHDVFDLTVDHPLHNFVANGLLVHNKTKPPSLCVLADGGRQYEYEKCACRGGQTGMLLCPPELGPVCQFCFGATDCRRCDVSEDAGSPDGG